MDDIDRRRLLKSLRGKLCPACGKTKRSGHTFCSQDYYRLRAGDRSALYRQFGDGYEEAFAAAIKQLGVKAPHWEERA